MRCEYSILLELVNYIKPLPNAKFIPWRSNIQFGLYKLLENKDLHYVLEYFDLNDLNIWAIDIVYTLITRINRRTLPKSIYLQSGKSSFVK